MAAVVYDVVDVVVVDTLSLLVAVCGGYFTAPHGCLPLTASLAASAVAASALLAVPGLVGRAVAAPVMVVSARSGFTLRCEAGGGYGSRAIKHRGVATPIISHFQTWRL